ncbi:hypothetical protein AMQ84_18820 [Paenibacillus riograndensis]|uniref:Uncharacterized protein n=1 Tax=Paenibacillus riograndensis TaxID=483937 RepID=A0A132TU86_9BACL|nr:hypothetical protein AMQ84_18820 [Paenibacillus riograndensis]
MKMNVQDRIRVDLLGRSFGKRFASDGWAYMLPFVFVKFKLVKFKLVKFKLYSGKSTTNRAHSA